MTQPGSRDAPFIPGSEYRIHDRARPQPRVVTPGTADGAPPSDALVLFDGKDLSGWMRKGDGAPADWKLESGYMEVVAGTGNIQSRKSLGDGQLHLEWAAPAEAAGVGTARGNSGVYLMGLYEVQILDCYDNETYADGTTGALYGQFPPLANACRPPGQWQSFDIVWVAPRFEDGKLLSPARITLLHNGVLLHHDQALLGPTLHKAIGAYAPHPPQGPLELQDHGDAVRFRNIWYRPLGGDREP